MRNLFKQQLVSGVEHTSKKERSLDRVDEHIVQGEQNHVNVKHILADAEDITVGAVVTARINSWKYTGTVLDLL